MRKVILLSAFGSVLLFQGCHTYVFQPVKKQLLGTWIKSPLDDNVRVEWTFTEDEKLYVINHFPSPAPPDTVESCDSLLYAGWHVENRITKHYLYTDNYSDFCLINDTPPRWLIVKLNKTTLYISSENDRRVRGSWQYGFTKK